MLALPRHDPWVRRHIGYCVVVGGDEVAAGKTPVEHAVKPVRFLHITIDGVRDLLGRVLSEVMVLAGHRSETADLPKQPPRCGRAPPQIVRQEPSRLVGEIAENGLDSNMGMASPPSNGAVSMIAGIRVFGEMARKSGLNGSPALMSSFWTRSAGWASAVMPSSGIPRALAQDRSGH